MRTKTLLLWSLACGLAILASGVALVWRLNNQDLAAPSDVGKAVSVGEMEVTVSGVAETGSTLDIDVVLSGVSDDGPADGFRLIASGREVRVDTTTCGPMATEPQRCRLTFDVGGADGTSRVLWYRRGEQQTRWVIAS